MICSIEFNASHDKSMSSFLTCSVCLLVMGSECVWAFGEGLNYQLEGLKIEFKQKEQFDPNFCSKLGRL